MRRYVLVVSGDNDRLHRQALDAARAAVEAINHAPVSRAWIEDGERQTVADELAREVEIRDVGEHSRLGRALAKYREVVG